MSKQLMKRLALIATLASLGMLALMYLFYQPMLDAPDTTIKDRFLLSITLVLQIYFLSFSVYISIKTGAIKLENEDQFKD